MEEKKINKPLTVAYEDFKRGLLVLINNSGFPAFIIETVLQSYLSEVRTEAQRQYQFDKAQYEQILQETNIDKDGD